MNLAAPRNAIVSAGRRLAGGCRPVCVVASLSAALWVMPAAWAQDEALEGVGREQAEEQALAEMLDRKMLTVTSVKFTDTPFSEAILRLGEQVEVNFILDLQAFENAGVQTDTPVTLDVHDISLQSVLGWLLEPLDLDWAYRRDAVMITSQDATYRLQSTRLYSVADLLERIGTHQADALSDLIRGVVAPTSWWDVGGPASGGIVGNCLVVHADRVIHVEIGRFLDDLRRAYGLDAPAAEVSDPDLAVIALLDKRLDVAFDDVPLVDACARLAEQSGANIVFDKFVLADGRVDIQASVTLHARDISLRSALSLLLKELDLTWVIRREVLVFIEAGICGFPEEVKLYPLGDLADNAQQAERIREFIEGYVAPETWDKVGGPGSIGNLPDLLIISHYSYIHDEIANLLARVRASGPVWRELAGAPGYDGYRRVVYRVSRMSPDDVASAIKATIAPESWQVGQGSVQVIRAEAAPDSATARPSVDAARANDTDVAPAAATGHLIVNQRNDVHDEIARLLRQLQAAGESADPFGQGGGLFDGR